MIRISHHVLIIFVFAMTSLRSVSSSSLCYSAKDDECTFTYNGNSSLGTYQPANKCGFLQKFRRNHWQQFGRCGFDPEDPRVPLVCCPEEFVEFGLRPRVSNFGAPTPGAPAPPAPTPGTPTPGTLTPGNIALKICEGFGTRPEAEDDNLDDDDRIIFGKRSDVSEFPYFVSLGYYNEEQNTTFNCGGALISKTHVITAAHCCTKSKMPVMVRMGKVRGGLRDSNKRFVRKCFAFNF